MLTLAAVVAIASVTATMVLVQIALYLIDTLSH